MAPPNNPIVPKLSLTRADSLDQYFSLSDDGKFSVKGVTLLSEIPSNVSFTEFNIICNYSESDAPFPLLQRVQSTSHRGGFFGFEVEEPADRVINSLGKFHDRNFLSIFRFKTWWSTQWVGKCGSDLQMET
ncbi:stachyose synthase-like [Chenopodium quinoa]|uniref:stachyose synthase-like n=1 Tax=Chenopodium quinoa TaxID=63459 RepID=UPI000B770DEC|nr:stachyose synthase-like [Chenopodium quinoa]